MLSRTVTIGLILLGCLLMPRSYAAKAYQRVQVADPYLELRTGPGGAYPIFHVVDRGHWLEILKRKTDWFKVRTVKGKEGWVDRKQMERTLTEAGVEKSFRDVLLEDYLSRRMEFGFGYGRFEGDPLLNVNAGFFFTPALSAELTLGEVSGLFSSSSLTHLSILGHPFTEWSWSPYFSIGVGNFKNTPKPTLIDAKDTDTTAAHAGMGLRYYLTRRFMLRADYKYYVVFVGDNRTEEYTPWTLGFSFFF